MTLLSLLFVLFFVLTFILGCCTEYREDAQSQDNPMQSGGELGGGFDSFLWGGELEKDDEYISETGEPEYGPTGDGKF